MVEETTKVLFISQDPGLPGVIARVVGSGFQMRTTDNFQILRTRDREWCDTVLLDLRAVSTRGDYEAAFRVIEEVNKEPLPPPIIVLYDVENRPLLRSAMERGAYDSVTNPPNMVELRLVLHAAAKSYAAQREAERLRANMRGAGRLGELRGTSKAMQEVFALAEKIAPCDVNVLITGETGTGKELLARAIHKMSSRSVSPLVAFSCSNLPQTLIEDELFGHEKGAFTGAHTMRRGRLEAANHGTLFLDEIGDLAMGLQPKLLRVLQEHAFERLGSNTTTTVDIRLICATNRPLAEMVQQGKFRKDLFYRLNVVHMHLPPLRERRNDISLLAQHFLEVASQQFNTKGKRFSQAALHALEEYAWPGNVRELENTVQRAVVLSESYTVDLWHLPVEIRKDCEPQPTVRRSYEEEVRQFKRRLLLRTLQECGWRKAESARTLGVARGYLHRLINQLDLRPEGSAAVNHPDKLGSVKGFQEAGE